jgi:hypothetical protein
MSDAQKYKCVECGKEFFLKSEAVSCWQWHQEAKEIEDVFLAVIERSKYYLLRQARKPVILRVSSFLVKKLDAGFVFLDVVAYPVAVKLPNGAIQFDEKNKECFRLLAQSVDDLKKMIETLRGGVLVAQRMRGTEYAGNLRRYSLLPDIDRGILLAKYERLLELVRKMQARMAAIPNQKGLVPDDLV